MRWDVERWRKLYRREEGSFALLPLYARALAAELLKFVDDDGRLFVGAREPWEAISRVAGATAGDRRLLRQHVPLLLDDGYLVHEGDYIRVRNMGPAQGRPRRQVERADHEPSASANRTEREPATNGERIDNDSARTEREPETKIDSSERDSSDHGLVHARAREEERRVDPKREEEIQSTHTADAHGSVAEDPDTAAVVVELRRSSAVLAAAATTEAGSELAIVRLAEVVVGFRVSTGKPLEWFVEAVRGGVAAVLAESSGDLTPPSWERFTDRVRAFAFGAKAPRGEREPVPARAPTELHAWTADRWVEARRRKKLGANAPEPKFVAEVVGIAEGAVAAETATDGWKPAVREVLAFWIRTYLAEKQEQAGGIEDKGWPLAFLPARCREYKLPRRSEVHKAPGSAPTPPRPAAPQQPIPPLDQQAAAAREAMALIGRGSGARPPPASAPLVTEGGP